MELINKKLLINEKINEFKEKFGNEKPFKHVLIFNFLDRDKAINIFNALKKEKFEHKESDLFSFSQTSDFISIDNEILRESYEFMRSKELGKFIEGVTGVKLQFGRIDMMGSLYKSCDYLLCHDDLLEGRKIAFVYYLSSLRMEDGGALVMYDSVDGNVGKEAKTIIPKFNSFLIFEVSKKSFHSVEEVIKGKRHAIGGWFY